MVRESAIEIGKTYVDGWGSSHRIAGITKDYPEWGWSIGGFWFRISDGRKITYTKDGGHHPISKPSAWDLREELSLE